MFQILLKSEVWQYLSATQKDLIQEGVFLGQVISNQHFKDYSFYVFPYAKAFEGYLKQLFLDIGFISHLDYISNHFRLGKYLSPHLIHRLGERSIYAQIREHSTEDMARNIWGIWSRGRNEVFHYYPHNVKRIDYIEAQDLSDSFLRVILDAYEHFIVTNNNHRSNILKRT
jgi:hypothetical protein